jgi:serine/threonine protein kinase
MGGGGECAPFVVCLLTRFLYPCGQAMNTNSRPDQVVEPTGAQAPAGEPQASYQLDTISFCQVTSTPATPVTPGAAPEQASQTLGDYQLLDRLGSGGMGVVYRARQRSANRLVALKIIRPERLADLSLESKAETLQRFLTEAQAAAQLAHDHIVTVYDVGEAKGQPYYSMRYIKGRSLAELLRAGPLDNRRAAELLAPVARAVHYAHQKGILHRDLKPQNVMLDEAERPYVADFGLAKLTESSSEVTRTGQVMGTAAYMSPEQAQDASQCTPASDTYSLGATLYELLTGRPPFRAANQIDTLRQVIHDEPVAPRLLNPAIDRDLETITLKCLEKDPARRYATAALLADELERVLSGEPILARPISASSRLWRQCKRRPLVSSLAALFVLSLLVGISVSSYFAVLANQRATLAEGRRLELQSKNTELKEAYATVEKRRLELQSTNQQLTSANITAEDRRIAAEEAATIAREQSQLALESLQSVIFDIQRKLENVPRAGDLRRSLLQTALAKLQKVSDQFASRDAIDRNSFVALNDLGDVFLRIGSDFARPGTPVIRAEDSFAVNADGPFAAARRAYEQAFAIAQTLAAADPSTVQAQLDLSIAYNKLGDVELRSGQMAEALASHQKSLEITQKLAAAFPSDAQAQRGLSVSYNKLGDVQFEAGKLKAALAAHQKMLEICQQLASADPSDAPTQRYLAIAYERVGRTQLRSGDVTEALGSNKEGLEIRQRLAVADPNDAQAQRDLSISYETLGDAQLRSGKVTEALEAYQQGMEVSQKLAAADPNDVQAQRDLFVSYNKLGNVQYQYGQETAALESYQKMLEISQQLTAADPSDVQAQRDLFVSYNKLGEVQFLSRELTAALASQQKMLEISQKLTAAEPSDSLAQRYLSMSYERLGDIQLQSRKLIEALGSFQKGLEIRQNLAAADPNDSQAQRDLFISYSRLGEVQFRSGLVTEALRSLQKGLEITQELAAADPSDAVAQFDLYGSHSRIAEAQQRQKEYEKAIDSYGRGLALLHSLKEQGRLAPANEKWIGVAERAIQHCKHAATASGDWKTLLEQPATMLPVLLEMRGRQFIQDGRNNDAIQAVAKLRELGTANADQLYNAACVYSLCAARIRPKGQIALSAEQVAERHKLIADALATLRESIQAGYTNFAHLQQNLELAPLRELPEFKALLPM